MPRHAKSLERPSHSPFPRVRRQQKYVPLPRRRGATDPPLAVAAAPSSFPGRPASPVAETAEVPQPLLTRSALEEGQSVAALEHPAVKIVIQGGRPSQAGDCTREYFPGDVSWVECKMYGMRSDALMFKRASCAEAKREIETLQRLRHPHILRLRHVLQDEQVYHLGFEWALYTLYEINHVSEAMDTEHLRAIGTTIFDILRYMANLRWVHHDINLRAIRVNPKGRVLLSNFQRAIRYDAEKLPRDDLRGLATVLVQCTDHRPSKPTTEYAHAIDQEDFEVIHDRPDHEVLVGFLKVLLNHSLETQQILNTKHEFLLPHAQAMQNLGPMLELAKEEVHMVCKEL